MKTDQFFCIAGKFSLAVNALKYLLIEKKIDKENLCIVANTDDKSIDTWQPSLKNFASRNSISIRNLNEIYQIKNLIYLSLEYDKIIKPVNFLTKHLFNFHFSLLPKYKGCHVCYLTLRNGEKESGVTLHLIDSGIDTGKIIDQKKFLIDVNLTAQELYEKLMENAYKLFVSKIDDLINNDYNPYEQKPGGSYNNKASVSYSDIKIDRHVNSNELHNQIRSLIFPSFQLPEIGGKKIYKSFLTNTTIKKNYFKLLDDKILLSGNDGLLMELLYKI